MARQKTIVVTGASGVLGQAICARLIESGYEVVGLVRDPSKLNSSLLYKGVVTVDLTSTSSVISGYKEVMDKYGTPFGLVNNAAIGTSSISLTQNQSEIEKVIAVNLLAPITLSKLFSRQMLDLHQGRIVMISSIASSKSYKGLAVYSAAKAGLEAYARGLAREVGSQGITVNSVLPGFMKTAMTIGLSDKQFESVARRTMVPELLRPDSVASMVNFLIGDEASQITGQSIFVDGGASN